NWTLTDVGEIDSGEESDVLKGEQFFKIQAVIGLPPAQFQPFIVTTTLDDEIATEIEVEEISNSLSEGRAHARSVIGNLIDRFEISPNQGQLHVSETLIPPAGLFQALKSLDQHEDSSEKLAQLNSELKVEITIDPNTETASLIDSVQFEVTPADVSVGIDATGATRQPESDTTYQVEVTQDLTFESGFIESDFIGVQPQKTAKGNSEGDDSSFELSQPQLALQSAFLEGRTDNAQVITAKTAEPTNETGPSVSAGSSQVQAQNASNLAVGEIPEKDLIGKIKSSTKQTTTRSEVNPKNLVNRVASAIRSAGQNGRQLRIRLQPPELGTLEIVVSSRNGVLSARLEVQTVSAQQAILENMSLLRDALSQNGTKLENIDVHLNERLQEGTQSDLSKEQQQDEQQSEQEQKQDDSDQSPDENESESRQQTVGLAMQIDQLDIQI
ncbi:MAG: flagellar hook-length control protein FliK, partial [Planctomycetes bacterium]|nr:flagellar hook-length control protein FliK [Planctomycetota bacterium]